jgi:hypothetical protein
MGTQDRLRLGDGADIPDGYICISVANSVQRGDPVLDTSHAQEEREVAGSVGTSSLGACSQDSTGFTGPDIQMKLIPRDLGRQLDGAVRPASVSMEEEEHRDQEGSLRSLH